MEVWQPSQVGESSALDKIDMALPFVRRDRNSPFRQTSLEWGGLAAA